MRGTKYLAASTPEDSEALDPQSNVRQEPEAEYSRGCIDNL